MTSGDREPRSMDDDDIADLTLADVLQAAAEGLGDVTVAATPQGRSWAVGPAVFAMLADEFAEFRLDPKVTAAALRTPDTAASARGSDWIVFRPPLLDDHAVDRAEAWFLSAHRRAAASGRG